MTVSAASAVGPPLPAGFARPSRCSRAASCPMSFQPVSHRLEDATLGVDARASRSPTESLDCATVSVPKGLLRDFTRWTCQSFDVASELASSRPSLLSARSSCSR